MDTIPVGEPFNRTGRTKGFHVAQIIQVLLFEPTNPTLTAGYVCVVTCCSQTVVVLKLSAENSVQLAVGKFKLGRLLPWYSESDSKTWTQIVIDSLDSESDSTFPESFGVWLTKSHVLVLTSYTITSTLHQTW